jgi:hypothetical protein
MDSHNTDPPAEVVGMYVVGILPGVASYIVELACTISLGSIDIWKRKKKKKPLCSLFGNFSSLLILNG